MGKQLRRSQQLAAQPSRVSAGLLFDATAMDRSIVDLLLKLRSQPRWPAFNAVRHLNAAWRIHDLDGNMAMFRAITAEEEAASAVLQSLKRHKYPGSEHLDPKKHLHKNAVMPFFNGMTHVFASIKNPPELRFVLDEKYRPPRLIPEIRLPIRKDGVWARSQQPLDITYTRSVDGGVTNVLEDFSAAFSKGIGKSRARTIGDYLRARANFRNRLLYASHDGYPNFGGDVLKYLREQKRNVFVLLRMFLLIDPYSKPQAFVSQCLTGFIATLTNLSGRISFD